MLRHALIRDVATSVTYFCNSCDGFLTRDGICSRVACRRRHVAPKRSKKGRRPKPNYTTLGAEEPSNSPWYLENSQGSSSVEDANSQGSHAVEVENSQGSSAGSCSENLSPHASLVSRLHQLDTSAQHRRRVASTALRSSGRRRTSPHSVSSMTTTQSDIPEGAIHNNRVDFEKLGQLVTNVESGPKYEESVIKKLRGCRIDMERVRAHTHAVSSIPTSSDSPVVRSLCETVRQQTDIIVGIAATIDSLISLGPAQDAALRRANSYVATASRGTLPGDRRFSVENLNRAWIMEAKPPFKKANFGISSPAGNAQVVLARTTTIPSSWIFAGDISGILTGKAGKDPELTDLPEDIVSFIIDFLMDALGLGNPDINKHERDLVARRSLFWNTLGSNDEERSYFLRRLKSAKVEWISLARKAIGRALTHLRCYHVKPDGTLVPPNKRKRPVLHSTENITSE